MNKKRFRKRALAVAAIAVMVGSLAGCGNASNNKSTVLAGKETESGAKASVTDVVSPVADVANKLGDMASSLVTEVTDEAVVEEEVVETVAEAKAEPAKASDSSGSGSSGSSGSGSGNSVPSTPAPHVHAWKEHTATNQVWVPNMVTVDDYEEKTVDNGYLECYCGKRFGLDEEQALYEHGKASALEYVRSGAAYTGAPEPCGGSLTVHDYQVEKVKVGSHQEDHGHYETNTYVDYYYCDCGARK